MDLYTSTALQNTRHGDLLAEADAARLAADGKTRSGVGSLVRSAGEKLTGLFSEARSARVVGTSPRAAAAKS
jgi:hypothetical protein